MQHEKLQYAIVTMPIEENMVKIHEKKQLSARIEALSKIQKDYAAYIEPLQEQVVQESLDIFVSHIEVKHILKISTEITKYHILVHSLEEVLEKEQCMKALTKAVR